MSLHKGSVELYCNLIQARLSSFVIDGILLMNNFQLIENLKEPSKT